MPGGKPSGSARHGSCTSRFWTEGLLLDFLRLRPHPPFGDFFLALVEFDLQAFIQVVAGLVLFLPHTPHRYNCHPQLTAQAELCWVFLFNGLDGTKCYFPLPLLL